MENENNYVKFLLLYLPWALAMVFSAWPVGSYFIAWLGSFFIFYVTLTGKIKALPADRTIAEQLMRPVFIVQIIFAGYMCCTSIFYFLSLMGYEYLTKVNTVLALDESALQIAAQCQRYYCLAHAAFVSGILIFMKYPVHSKYYIEKEKLANLLLQMALITFPVSLLFLKLPGLSQFYVQLGSLSFIAGTLALAFAIPLRKMGNTLICAALYLFNFYEAFTSGFKEPIIISILVLGVFLYPSYKKFVTVTFVPLLLLLFIYLPSFVGSLRQNNWSGEESKDDAAAIALDVALNQDADDNSNWGFLIYRLSEIEMFTKFVKSTPANVDFYGTDLIKQSAIAIVPRVLWPAKPITEDLIMERVYAANVVNRNSNVSAKPAYVVDAYLSYGAIGIFIYLFAYGAAAQIIAIKAEKLFGGYTLGAALIFSGLFQIFWRGLSFEFLVNSVFWSYVTMIIVFKILKSKNILKEI